MQRASTQSRPQQLAQRSLLCEAAGCGENSGEAVAGAEADSGGRGEAWSG
jgi:hypothetical protein